jgi:hypothetical protein
MEKPEYDYLKVDDCQLIEIKIKKVGQLFNSFDPSPFLEKDLDDDAFEYIVSSVAEHALKTKQKIVIYMPMNQKQKISELEIKRAIHHFFGYKAALAEKSIKLKLQEGQLSFVLGIVFLSACLGISKWLSTLSENVFMTILVEGLIIGGWVAMWKPISNILYDWWPLHKERRIYEKIANMEVDFHYT